MNNKKNKASYTLAFSQFSLAAALIYFTIEISGIVIQIPDILSSVEKTSEKINPIVSEIGKVREQIPLILKEIEEVRKQIPPVLDEVKELRQQLPAILVEVKEVREQIPAVLVEVKEIRQQVPLVLTEVKLYRQQIPLILDEVEEVRILVPDILTEVASMREAIPPMLVQGERMIREARTAGKEASEGAVTGVFTGIIKAPFKLVGGLGRSMFGSSSHDIAGFTEGDKNLAGNIAVTILEHGKLGEKLTWANPESGNDGTITFFETKKIDGKECRVFRNVVRIAGNEKINNNITACQNKDSEWDMIEK